MTTTTKFNIGDEVFFLHQNRVESANVVIIEIKVQAGSFNVVNTINFCNGGIPLKLEDKNLFPTKKDLLESL